MTVVVTKRHGSRGARVGASALIACVALAPIARVATAQTRDPSRSVGVGAARTGSEARTDARTDTRLAAPAPRAHGQARARADASDATDATGATHATGAAHATNGGAKPAADAEAVDLYRASVDRYREGRYAEAAALSREAYRRAPDPVLLYNLARACEKMDDLACAIDAYTRYLAQATPADRGDIERRIAAYRADLAARGARERKGDEPRGQPRADAPPDEARAAASTPSSRAEAKGGEASRADSSAAPMNAARPGAARAASPVMPWVVVGAGVAAIGAGAALVVVARAQHRDAVDDPVQSSAADRQATSERTMTAAEVTLAVGGALTAFGALWAALDARAPSASSSSVGLSFGPGAVRVRVAF